MCRCAHILLCLAIANLLISLALHSCVVQNVIEREVLPCSYCFEVSRSSFIQDSFYCDSRNQHFDMWMLSATYNHKRLRSDHGCCTTSCPRLFRVLSLSLSRARSLIAGHTLYTSHRSRNPDAASFKPTCCNLPSRMTGVPARLLLSRYGCLSVTSCSFRRPRMRRRNTSWRSCGTGYLL
jgi:hypothetical protein